MNGNQSGVESMSKSASRFVDAYRGLNASINDIGVEIEKLMDQINVTTKEYNITDPDNFTNENSVTAEYIYSNMSDAEKFKDDKGNIVPFENLLNEQRDELEAKAKTLNEGQVNAKNTIVALNSQVAILEAKFETIVNSNKNAINKAYMNFVIEKENIKSDMTILREEIAKNNRVINALQTAPDLAATDVAEKTARANAAAEAYRQGKILEVKKGILNAVSKAADLYEIAFRAINENISINMFDAQDALHISDGINEELSIAERINKLANNLNVTRYNYSKDKDVIDEIEKSIKDFSNSYGDLKNASQFIKSSKASIAAIKAAIKQLEGTEKLRASSGFDPEDGLGNNEPAPTEPNPGEPAPAEPNPGEPAPAEPAPAEPNPGEPAPAEPNPGEPAPAEPNPGEPDPTKDPIYKVNRTRMASAALASKITNVGVVTYIAATALGLGPVGLTIGGVLAAAGVGAQALGALTTAISRGCSTWKLKRIAKKISKMHNINVKLGKPDFEKGTIAFQLVDADDKIDIVDGCNLPPKVLTDIQTMLDKSFKNASRDCVKAGDYNNLWLKEMPKVTINNLQAAYATTGGIIARKDEFLGNRNVWSTTSDLVGRIRDGKMKNSNGVDSDVEEVEVDEINTPNPTEGAATEEEEVIDVPGDPIVEGEDAPTEDTPSEDTPSEETPTEGVPSGDASSDENPSDEGSVDEEEPEATEENTDEVEFSNILLDEELAMVEENDEMNPVMPDEISSSLLDGIKSMSKNSGVEKGKGKSK